MKNFFIVTVFLSFSGLTFAEAPEQASEALQCNIDNYQDIVFQYNAEPPRCDLKEANFYIKEHLTADLNFADFREANLVKANFTKARLQNADFRGADLREANLREAMLSGANFEEANLRGADLSQATFYLANFAGADLRGALLYGQEVKSANFAGAKVTAQQAEFLTSQDRTGFIIVEE